ncbi:MAG TPA: PIN-like domain-containing protein, partial [Chloroflexia bacterium]
LYDELFAANVVLDPPTPEEDIYADLQRRLELNIPPGYKDKGKTDQGIGDLLIWHTILYVGSKDNSSVIFVSADEKADWRQRGGDKALYPRYELVNEFARATGGQAFHIVKVSDLLALFGADQRIVDEVKLEEVQVRSESGGGTTEDMVESWRERATRAARDWVLRQSSAQSATTLTNDWRRFTVQQKDGTRVTYSIGLSSNGSASLNKVVEGITRARAQRKSEGATYAECVLVLPSAEAADQVARTLLAGLEIDKDVSISVGYLDGDVFRFSSGLASEKEIDAIPF